MRVEFKAFKAGRNSQELFEEIEKFPITESLAVGVGDGEKFQELGWARHKVDLHSI